MILIISGFLLFVVYGGLLIYYRRSWVSIKKFVKSGNYHLPSITVIIPARNEALNLPELLHSLKAQEYPSENFQVIVVDDHSTDTTASIVENFAVENVELLRLKDFLSAGINSYKKKAIEVAITRAKGELIVTTDADCIVKPTWLREIADFYAETKANFIVMPVLMNNKSNLIETFQVLDFMTLQGITGASVHDGVHSMCNGANLAYTKSAYNKVEGFKGIDEIASGDDMLLMHKITKEIPGTTFYLKSDGVIVTTEAMPTIKDFLHQRIRWASKASVYDDKRIVAVLLLVYLFNVVLVLIPFAAIFDNRFEFAEKEYTMIGCWLLLLIFKIIVELFFLFPVASFFGKQRLLTIFPFLQLFHIIYTVIAGWLGKFGNYTWKGRVVN